MIDIVPVSEFTDIIPVPVNGVDPVIAESVVPAFQAVANRTEFLKDAISSGASKLRWVDSTAAMQSLSPVTHGECCVVIPPTGPGPAQQPGLFVFTAAAPAQTAFAYIGYGGGYWVPAFQLMRATPYGLATLNSSLQLEQRPSWTYAPIDKVADLGTLSSITIATEFATYLLTAETLVAGDIIHVTASMILALAAGFSGLVEAQYKIGAGAWTGFSGRASAGHVNTGASTVSSTISCCDYVVAPSSGSYSVRLLATPVGGAVSFSIAKSSVRVVRP